MRGEGGTLKVVPFLTLEEHLTKDPHWINWSSFAKVVQLSPFFTKRQLVVKLNIGTACR